MRELLTVEHLKYKRTFVRKLVFLAPLFFLLIIFPQYFLMAGYQERPWEMLLALVYNWWPVIFIPFGTALIAVLVEQQERRAGNYQGLRTRFVSLDLIWHAKILLIAYHILLATIVLVGVVLILGLGFAQEQVPWLQVCLGALLLWLTSLPIIPFQLWLTHKLGIAGGMLGGIGGFFLGVIAAPERYWFLVPWSWSTRLMSPLIGVHPNGTFLEPSSPLWDGSVIGKGALLSVFVFGLGTYLTGLSFKTEEVKER